VHRQTVSPDPLAPPDTEIAGHLRRVAYAHSLALQDGEPPPPPDADADRCSFDDIVRALRTQV
jgi:hypothetical protein